MISEIKYFPHSIELLFIYLFLREIFVIDLFGNEIFVGPKLIKFLASTRRAVDKQKKRINFKSIFQIMPTNS